MWKPHGVLPELRPTARDVMYDKVQGVPGPGGNATRRARLASQLPLLFLLLFLLLLLLLLLELVHLLSVAISSGGGMLPPPSMLLFNRSTLTPAGSGCFM